MTYLIFHPGTGAYFDLADGAIVVNVDDLPEELLAMIHDTGDIDLVVEYAKQAGLAKRINVVV